MIFTFEQTSRQTVRTILAYVRLIVSMALRMSMLGDDDGLNEILGEMLYLENLRYDSQEAIDDANMMIDNARDYMTELYFRQQKL